MKDKIKLYYNLEVDNYLHNYFYSDGIYYQLIKWERTNDELKDIVQICKELKEKKIKYNEILLNVNGSYISDRYLLLKLSYFLDDIFNLNDILQFNNKLVLKQPYINNWLDIWKSKIDYLEYQVKQLGYNKKSVIASFSYYVGLAENAIQILNKINSGNQDSLMVLSRLRVKYPNYCNDYFNPTSFLFDSMVRDIAEYLKSKFFANLDIEEDLNILYKSNFTPYEYNLFFVRMLYPSYYFDALEEVLLNGKDEKLIVDVVNKVDEYEKLLASIMSKLSKLTNVEIIPWLLKKE